MGVGPGPRCVHSNQMTTHTFRQVMCVELLRELPLQAGVVRGQKLVGISDPVRDSEVGMDL